MPGKTKKLSRRDFIKTASSMGLGSTLIPLSPSKLAYGSSSKMEPEEVIVPKRPYGKTGVNVSILSLVSMTTFIEPPMIAVMEPVENGEKVVLGSAPN